jgi:hypothetical protein
MAPQQNKAGVVRGWVVPILAGVALVLAVVSFICVFSFQRRGLPDDGLAAVAAALIGIILLVGGVAGIQYTRGRHVEPHRKYCRSTRFGNGVVRIISGFLGSIGILGGIAGVTRFFVLLNQEYLHWFKSSHSIGSTSGGRTMLLIDFGIMGFVLPCIGIFLLLYATRPLSHFEAAPDKATDEELDSNTDERS